MLKVNLCGVGLKDFVNVDISLKADKIRDLEFMRIPFKSNSVDVLICMSAINYFSKKRAEYLIKDVYRVLKVGGVCRFGVQDLEKICFEYLKLNPYFSCERINSWFGNDDKFNASGKRCKYLYDRDTLVKLFVKTEFAAVTTYAYRVGELGEFDNRPEQMFFIECVK